MNNNSNLNHSALAHHNVSASMNLESYRG